LNHLCIQTVFDDIQNISKVFCLEIDSIE
jgi:hypothetical protein